MRCSRESRRRSVGILGRGFGYEEGVEVARTVSREVEMRTDWVRGWGCVGRDVVFGPSLEDGVGGAGCMVTLALESVGLAMPREDAINHCCTRCSVGLGCR
jgi:hypothetical protein